jgi:hypothetical protein
MRAGGAAGMDRPRKDRGHRRPKPRIPLRRVRQSRTKRGAWLLSQAQSSRSAAPNPSDPQRRRSSSGMRPPLREATAKPRRCQSRSGAPSGK